MDEEGRAYVFEGTADGLAAEPSWIKESDQANANYGCAVATAGDVNGDGYSDVIVGANGFDRLPRQLQPSGDVPIALLGESNSVSSVGLAARGETAGGRGDVFLEWEIKPLGTAFDGTQIGSGDAVDSGAPVAGQGSAAELTAVIAGLSGATPYHWRLRIGARSAFFPRTPWLTMQGNGWLETDFFTSRDLTPVDPTAADLPRTASLAGSYPNPFNPRTSVRYSIARPAFVDLTIYNVAGERVRTLIAEPQGAGSYEVTWNGLDAGGSPVASGIYFCRLTVADEVVTGKMTLVRWRGTA